MKNKHNSPFSNPFSKSLHITFLLMLASLLPTYLQGQQSLFDMAVTLDKQYGELLKNDSAAVPFFDELEKFFKLEDKVKIDQIKNEFTENKYMYEKVEIAFHKASQVNKQVKDKIIDYEKQIDSLYLAAIDSAEIACNLKSRLFSRDTRPVTEQPKPCGIDSLLGQLPRSTKSTLDKLNELHLKSKDEKLKKYLKNTSAKIVQYKEKISREKEGAESIFQLTAKAGGGIPFSQSPSMATQSLSPIILQEQGSGSLGGSIIDGTSKWIAERMKEELSIAFFDRFEYWVEGANIKTLFPNTFSALKSSVTSDYSLMIQIFKTAFEKDLKHLPFNISGFLEQELDYAKALDDINGDIIKSTAKINEIKRILEKHEIELKQLEERFFSFDYEATSGEPMYYEEDLEEPTVVIEPTDSLEEQDSSGVSELTVEADTSELTEVIDTLGEEDYSEYSESFDYSEYELTDPTEILYYETSFKVDSLRYELDLAQSALNKNEGRSEEAFKVLKYVLFTVKAIQLLSEGEHPTSLLSYLNENIDELFPQAGNVKPALLIMDIVSRSMISVDPKNNTVWLKSNELSELRTNARLRDFYFGLIYQEIRQSLRREKIVLDEELKNTIQYEIFDTGIGYYASEKVFNAPYYATLALYGDDYNYDYYAELKSIDEVLTNETLGKFTTDQERTKLKNTTLPLYEEIKQINTIDINGYDSTSLILSSKIDIIAELPEVKALVNSNPYFQIIAVEDLYDIPYMAIDSLYGDMDPSKITMGQRDNVIGLSRKILTSKLNERFPFEFPSKKEFIKVAADFMEINMNWVYKDGRLSIMKDSIVKEVTNIYIKAAQRDSTEMIANEIEKNEAVQKVSIQLQRLDYHQRFVDSLLLKNRRGFGDIVNGFVQFANKMDFINSEFKKLREKENSKFGTQEFIYLLRNSLDALHQIYEIALPNKKDQPTLKKIQALTVNLLDAYAAVLEKDYDAVVMNIIPVADSLLEMSYQLKVDELKKLKKAEEEGTELDPNLLSDFVIKILDNKIDLTNKSKKELDKEINKEDKKKLRKIYKKPWIGQTKNIWALELDTLLEEKENKIRKMHEIFKYGAFLAAVVESKDADQIKKAIQAVALPAGSYSIKRRAFRNISLNAYPGLTGGLELASNTTDHVWAPNFGFTAPVGLAISWGYKTKIDGYKYFTKQAYRRRVDNSVRLEGNRFLSGHAGTLFMPLIDLGAVVLFRLDSNEEALPENIGFQQIFSPGIMYAHGLPDLPISIMGGVQISPQLRKIGEEKANSFRFNISFVVDLPLANFHTQMRYK